MKIPKKITLLNSTYTVEIKPDLLDDQGAIGQFDSLKGKIFIQPNSNISPIIQNEIEQTFLHELVHAILYKMEKQELFKDEAFVNQFASLLHQAYLTKKGELILDKKKKGNKNERSISRTSKKK